jgi:hypothetical protein
METNEALKKTLLSLAETGVETLVESLQKVKDGNLQELEQQILVQVLAFGQACLEQILGEQAKRAGSPARREGTCGHRQRLVSMRSRQVFTLFGVITIHRAYYQCLGTEEQTEKRVGNRCGHGEAPFDQHWGLTGQRSSPGLQKAVSYLCAHLTNEGVAEALSRLLPLQISPRQVGNVSQPIGEAFEQREEQEAQAVVRRGANKHTDETERQEEKGEPIKRLYVEMDGVMARLRRGSVPMEAGEQERAGDVYREVKVGAVFVGEPGRERSKLVPGVFVDTPGPIQYTARRTTAEGFAPQIYALAHRAGLRRAAQVVILADGAKWIWRLAEEQFPGAIQIVDEYHARQHVWEVARFAFAAQPPERDAWARGVIEKLSEGQIEEVIAAIERLPPLAPEPGKTRSLPQIEADYFRTNSERMRYPIFRAQGMHLGSGIAEAACKTVVSTRAKRSGMRWTPEGLDAILALRTSALNGSFDLCWQAIREAA